MIEVKFKFDVDQRVITPFGQEAIVDNCTLDNGKLIQYYVKTSDGAYWYKETELKAKDE